MLHSVSRTQPSESFAIEGELSNIYFREFTLAYLPPGKYKVSAAIIDDMDHNGVNYFQVRQSPIEIDIVAYDVSGIGAWKQLKRGVIPSTFERLKGVGEKSSLTRVTFSTPPKNPAITIGHSSRDLFEIKETTLITIMPPYGWKRSKNHRELIMLDYPYLGSARNLTIIVEKVE